MQQSKPGVDVKLVKSGGGVFEIRVDGRLKYSKKKTGAFPTDKQLLEAIG